MVSITSQNRCCTPPTEVAAFLRRSLSPSVDPVVTLNYKCRDINFEPFDTLTNKYVWLVGLIVNYLLSRLTPPLPPASTLLYQYLVYNHRYTNGKKSIWIRTKAPNLQKKNKLKRPLLQHHINKSVYKQKKE